MKPARFDYEKPRDLATAISLLSAAGGEAKVLAGGQSLGPMLNLRFVQPSLLVDVRGLAELREVRETPDAVVVGAAVTHAMIEDAAVPDPTRGMLRAVAGDIAYRPVRNRGTLGGSLAHADPAADWPNALLALGATILVAGPAGSRDIPIDDFFAGPYATALGEDEIITGVRLQRLSDQARWGYWKFCRKPGEFAEAMAAVVHDPARGTCRVVIGATSGTPCLVDNAAELLEGCPPQAVARALELAGFADDDYDRQVHAAALRRALARMAPNP